MLGGQKDIVTLPQASQTISERLVDSRLSIIEGCGHMGFMERSEVYNDEIAAFASRVLQPAA